MLVGFETPRHRQRFLRSLSRAERQVVRNGRLLFEKTAMLERFYRAADVSVTNAQGLGEPFGRATIEAMTFGLPVLGTQAGGTSEIIIHGETGLLYPVGDRGQEELTSHLLSLCSDRGLASRIGHAAQIRANEVFAFDQFLHRFVECLEGMNTFGG